MQDIPPASEKEAAEQQKKMTKIAVKLYERFGRPPTEEEVKGFIFGTDEERRDIWNFGIPHTKGEQ